MLYKDGSNASQPLDAASVPAWTNRRHPQIHPSLMLLQLYSYPHSGKITVYLLQSPVIMGGQPVEEEGMFRKYLSLAVETLKAVATAVIAIFGNFGEFNTFSL
jgi:hypothetical protein